MLNILYVLLIMLFGASILMTITEVIISCSEDKKNPKKSRQKYLIIFFFILFFLINYLDNMRENYINNMIMEAESLEELQEEWITSREE